MVSSLWTVPFPSAGHQALIAGPLWTTLTICTLQLAYGLGTTGFPTHVICSVLHKENLFTCTPHEDLHMYCISVRLLNKPTIFLFYVKIKHSKQSVIYLQNSYWWLQSTYSILCQAGQNYYKWWFKCIIIHCDVLINVFIVSTIEDQLLCVSQVFKTLIQPTAVYFTLFTLNLTTVFAEMLEGLQQTVRLNRKS